MIDWIHEGKHITVFREDITNLVGNKVVLSNGDALVTDVLLYATGYEIAQNIFSLEDSVSFGLPTRKDQYPEELTQYWADLETKADSTVDECFPRLASPPPIRWVKHTHTPYRLYRHIVPVPLLRTRDRSLIFAGTVTAVSTAIMSEVVCLWSIAWLTDNLDIDAHPADADWDIALRNSFSRKRYLNIGARAPYVLYDWMPVRNDQLISLIHCTAGLTYKSLLTACSLSLDLKGLERPLSVKNILRRTIPETIVGWLKSGSKCMELWAKSSRGYKSFEWPGVKEYTR